MIHDSCMYIVQISGSELDKETVTHCNFSIMSYFGNSQSLRNILCQIPLRNKAIGNVQSSINPKVQHS